MLYAKWVLHLNLYSNTSFSELNIGLSRQMMIDLAIHVREEKLVRYFIRYSSWHRCVLNILTTAVQTWNENGFIVPCHFSRDHEVQSSFVSCCLLNQYIEYIYKVWSKWIQIWFSAWLTISNWKSIAQLPYMSGGQISCERFETQQRCRDINRFCSSALKVHSIALQFLPCKSFNSVIPVNSCHLINTRSSSQELNMSWDNGTTTSQKMELQIMI